MHWPAFRQNTRDSLQARWSAGGFPNRSLYYLRRLRSNIYAFGRLAIFWLRKAGIHLCRRVYLLRFLGQYDFDGETESFNPSFADRKFGGLKDEELVISMKMADLKRAVDGVEQLYKNGLRYPIAPYSITTDMIDGLPKSYLEY